MANSAGKTKKCRNGASRKSAAETRVNANSVPAPTTFLTCVSFAKRLGCSDRNLLHLRERSDWPAAVPTTPPWSEGDAVSVQRWRQGFLRGPLSTYERAHRDPDDLDDLDDGDEPDDADDDEFFEDDEDDAESWRADCMWLDRLSLHLRERLTAMRAAVGRSQDVAAAALQADTEAWSAWRKQHPPPGTPDLPPHTDDYDPVAEVSA